MDRTARDIIWLTFDLAVAGTRIGTIPMWGPWKPTSLDSAGVRGAMAEAEVELAAEAGWYRRGLLGLLGWYAYCLVVLAFFFVFVFSHLAVPVSRLVGATPVLVLLEKPLLVLLPIWLLPLLVWVVLEIRHNLPHSVVPPRRLLEIRLAVEQRGQAAVQEIASVAETGRFPLVSAAMRRRNALSRAIAAVAHSDSGQPGVD